MRSDRVQTPDVQVQRQTAQVESEGLTERFDLGLDLLGSEQERQEHVVGQLPPAVRTDELDAGRRALMQAELERILAQKPLSNDVFEIVSRALAEPGEEGSA